jgi:hypothetical protein
VVQTLVVVVVRSAKRTATADNRRVRGRRSECKEAELVVVAQLPRRNGRWAVTAGRDTTPQQPFVQRALVLEVVVL